MNFAEIAEVVGLMFWASVKFLFAPSTVALAGYSFWETVGITIVGGFMGVLFFYFASGWVMKTYVNLVPSKKNPKPKKVMTRKNKLIIWVKQNFGIVGLSLITPSLISIPLGSILAARFFSYDKRTVPFLLLSVVFWSFVLSALSTLIF